jgi:hypothetical protein
MIRDQVAAEARPGDRGEVVPPTREDEDGRIGLGSWGNGCVLCVVVLVSGCDPSRKIFYYVLDIRSRMRDHDHILN